MMNQRLGLLEKLIDASRTIALHLDPYEATNCIVSEGCRLLDCDRATVFTKDQQANELILMVAEGAEMIRLPVGTGIAGSVADTGDLVNIPDPYEDDRFDATHDQNTGYRTQNILCGPIKDSTGTIVGVLQAINHNGGPFGEVEEEVMGILSAQAGIALANAGLFRQINREREKFRSLVDVISAMQNDMGINSLMFTITNRAHCIVDADRCTLFLVDERADELWSAQGEVNIRIPKNAGIAGSVATTGEVVNIPNAYEDDRFNPDNDKKSGYTTRTILCMPIKAEGEVVGVLQLINKSDGPFSGDDEAIMSSFLAIAGPILASSQLFQHTQAEEGNEMQGASLVRKKKQSMKMAAIPMEEGDEEEEEEETNATLTSL